MLRMCVHAAPGVTHLKRIPEERRAGRLLEILRGSTKEDGIAGGTWEGEDEDVLGFDTFLLYPGRCNSRQEGSIAGQV
jgi:hypothetical protein